MIEGADAMMTEGYYCPRRPHAHSVDAGFSVRDEPPSNCAAAITGACLEPAGSGNSGLIVDEDCCTPCGEGSCAPGYTYAGQFLMDIEMLSSTYPDFSYCGQFYCGNTCCVPVETNETARVAAGG